MTPANCVQLKPRCWIAPSQDQPASLTLPHSSALLWRLRADAGVPCSVKRLPCRRNYVRGAPPLSLWRPCFVFGTLKNWRRSLPLLLSYSIFDIRGPRYYEGFARGLLYCVCHNLEQTFVANFATEAATGKLRYAASNLKKCLFSAVAGPFRSGLKNRATL